MVGEKGLEPLRIATLDPKLPVGNQACLIAANPCGRWSLSVCI